MSVNSSVNKQFEKMFEIFNKEFFESELEMPLFRFQSKCGDGSFNPDAVIDQGTKYSHEIIVPIEVLGDKIENIAACLLHNMIHYWAFIKGYKVSCNNDFYHNKNFKSMAEYCGLETEYDETKEYGEDDIYLGNVFDGQNLDAEDREDDQPIKPFNLNDFFKK